MRIVVLLVALMLNVMVGMAQEKGSVFVVENTAMAHLHSLGDVLQQIPDVTYLTEEGFKVVGYGVPVIYIGERRLTEADELWRIGAGSVASVEILRSPGARYDSDVEVVIRVKLKRNTADGFHLNEYFNTALNSRIAASNELALSYHTERVSVSGMLAFNHERNEQDKDVYTQNYRYLNNDFLLKNTTKKVEERENNSKTLTAKTDMEYCFSTNQSVKIGFALYRTFDNLTWARNRILYTYGLNAEGSAIDYDTPVATGKEADMRHNMPSTRRESYVDYHARVGRFTFNAGYNGYSLKKDETTRIDGQTDIFDRTEGYDRVYGNANAEVWKGSVLVGADYTNNSVEFLKTEGSNTHLNYNASSSKNILAGFMDLSQKFGVVELGAGLRYEDSRFSYRTLPSDASYLHAGKKFYDANRNETNWFPNGKVALHLGNHTITASYNSSKVGLFLENIRINFAMGSLINRYYLPGEKIRTTSLSWQWKWIGAYSAYKHIKDPAYEDVAGELYLGKDFNTLDVGLTLTPKIYIVKSSKECDSFVYSPQINMHFQKQWLEANLPDGITKLNKPMFMATLNNVLTMPHNWLVRLNGNFSSKGYNRNIYTRQANLNMDMGVQKDFLQRKLTVAIDVKNMLNTNNQDITVYDFNNVKQFKGYYLTTPTTLLLSVRYKM